MYFIYIVVKLICFRCFRTVVLKKTLESPLDCKEIKPVNPKGNQSWIFIGRLILKLKLQYFSHLTRQVSGKDPDAGKDWRQEEKGITEDEMVGWHHWLSGHEFEQAPGDGEGWRSLGAAVHGVAKSWTGLNNNKPPYCVPGWNTDIGTKYGFCHFLKCVQSSGGIQACIKV